MKKSKLDGWKNRFAGAVRIAVIAAAGIALTVYLASWKSVPYRLIAIIWATAAFCVGITVLNRFGSMRSDEYYQSGKANLRTALNCLFGRHEWDGCRCAVCGEIRGEGHDYDGCYCRRCGNARHRWDNGICSECGTVCIHASRKEVYSENYGQMDYSSYGGPVEDFVVTLEKCADCGELFKTGRGDYCGDESELLKITEEDIAMAKDV